MTRNPSGTLSLFVDRETQEAVEAAPKTRVRWSTSYRLQLAKYPPISLFERIAPTEDHDILDELQKLTDPIARQALGQISIVPKSKRVFGKGATGLMAPIALYSDKNPSRFTDGTTYGVYYAGHRFETAVREVAFHRARFHLRTKDGPTETTYKVIKTRIDRVFHDIRNGSLWGRLLDPDLSKYEAPQKFAAQLREQGSNGIVYPSVRQAGGECIGAFWPNVLRLISDDGRVALKWDGKTIVSWFDFDTGEWSPL
jgi:hypothetical protein